MSPILRKNDPKEEKFFHLSRKKIVCLSPEEKLNRLKIMSDRQVIRAEVVKITHRGILNSVNQSKIEKLNYKFQRFELRKKKDVIKR